MYDRTKSGTFAMKKMLHYLLAGWIGLGLAKNLEAADAEMAVIETSKGTLTIELWSDVAPKSVANFKQLAKEGFYDGTAFHRIISGMLAQGGDPLTKDPSKENQWGKGGPKSPIAAEFNARPHTFGVVSMAPYKAPNKSGSQFFFCLGNAPQLNGKCSPFGKIKSGEDVLKTIGKVPVKTAPNGERSKPSERIEIKSIRIKSGG